MAVILASLVRSPASIPAAEKRHLPQAGLGKAQSCCTQAEACSPIHADRHGAQDFEAVQRGCTPSQKPDTQHGMEELAIHLRGFTELQSPQNFFKE